MAKQLWERSPYQFIKGGGANKKKRKTKGQLVKQFYNKGGNKLPKIDTEVREGADDITEGVAYEIVNVEEIVTDVQQYSGIRVTCLSVKAEEGNVVLWQRKVTGKDSKLGVFLTLLGNDTDKWLHKWVVFRTWQLRNRLLELVEAPAPKASKPSTPKVSSTKKP